MDLKKNILSNKEVVHNNWDRCHKSPPVHSYALHSPQIGRPPWNRSNEPSFEEIGWLDVKIFTGVWKQSKNFFPIFKRFIEIYMSQAKKPYDL